MVDMQLTEWMTGSPCDPDNLVYCHRCKPRDLPPHVYRSAWSTTFHKAPGCKALAAGQGSVERRRGTPSEVWAFTSGWPSAVGWHLVCVASRTSRAEQTGDRPTVSPMGELPEVRVDPTSATRSRTAQDAQAEGPEGVVRAAVVGAWLKASRQCPDMSACPSARQTLARPLALAPLINIEATIPRGSMAQYPKRK